MEDNCSSTAIALVTMPSVMKALEAPNYCRLLVQLGRIARNNSGKKGNRGREKKEEERKRKKIGRIDEFLAKDPSHSQ